MFKNFFRTNSAETLLKRLVLASDTNKIPGRWLVIAAHPDDETVGLGGRLGYFENLLILHTTDGAPENMADAHNNGFEKREDYAMARRAELYAALKVVNLGPEACYQIAVPDQQASYNLVLMIQQIMSFITGFRPGVILTHPYEGGHPDHDSTAFAVHSACKLLKKSGKDYPVILEYASYNNHRGRMTVFEFLDYEDLKAISVRLNEDEKLIKQKMFNCFKTQRQTLKCFPVEAEIFRKAPNYDFSLPPHEGKLYYDNFNWGINALRWRSLAREAEEFLEIKKVRL